MSRDKRQPYNMIVILSDQEAYALQRPKDYELAARAELSRRGTSFERHYIASAMCTPSRGVLFSGQPPQVNGIFDQMQCPYVASLSTDKPSMGKAMRALGYKTAYFGKFELRQDIIYPSDSVNYQTALTEHGFDVYSPDGDKTGGPNQGYQVDVHTAAEGNRWLRANAQDMSTKGQPWFLVISLINPHDIMYANANLPGEQVQVMEPNAALTLPAKSSLYEKQWEFALSASRLDPVDGKGRPAAQLEYLQGWSYWLGNIPADRADMWRLFYNYYLNLLRDNDRTLQTVLETIRSLDLWKNTIVIQTADHGELAGSHGGLRGKGPFPFEEQTHVPFVVVHPDYPGGRRCKAVTSHIDFIPTLAGLTGLSEEACAAATGGMPGHDLSPLLMNPEASPANAARDGALFNYTGLMTIDAKYLEKISTYVSVGKPSPSLTELCPDVSKRGFLSFAFDGRYKLARYYAPNAFNTPTTREQILDQNDVELFDLEKDPHERTNLADDPQQNDLLLRMNALLNKLIAQEVGVNDGQFLPAQVRPPAKSAG
jgi:arylsulfatase A-like enzyme